MKAKSLFYALLAMVMVGAAASCQRHDEEPLPSIQPEVTIVKNEVEGKPANVVSFTITTQNAVEGYWYIGDAIDGMNYVVENGTRFTEESIVVEYTMPWNDSKCIWVVAISKDGTQTMELEEIFVGEEPVTEPELSTVVGVYGYYGKTFATHFDIYFQVEGEEFVEVRFNVRGIEGSRVIPEGTYLYGDDGDEVTNGQSGFIYINDIGRYVKDFKKASLEVKHIGNEYQFVATAEGYEDGEVFAYEWTGQIERGDKYPFYNPGEETPESETGMRFALDYGVIVNFWETDYDVYFCFSDGTELRRLLISVDTDDDTNGLLPEGRYDLDAETIIQDRVCVMSFGGDHIADIVKATLVVEYVGNEYRMVLDAEDSEGCVYKVDWTGRADTSQSVFPIYHPGDEIPELMPFERVYGYGGGAVPLQVIFQIDVYKEVIFTLECGDEKYIIPEGEYLLNGESKYIENGNSMFIYYSDTERPVVSVFVEASMVVEHIGNEYHIVAHAVGENGDVFDVDWTGRIEAGLSDYPIYNPGDETPGPEASYEVYGYGGTPYHDFEVYIHYTRSYGVDESHCFLFNCGGAKYIIPEGIYTLNGTDNYTLDSNSHFYYIEQEQLIPDLYKEATFEVKHVGSDYQISIHAVTESGREFNIDWTGRIESLMPDMPIYNPGDVTPE